MGDVVLGELIAAIPNASEQAKTATAQEGNIDVYIVVAKEERRSDALAVVQALRNRNYRVDFSLTPAKVGKQFQTAEQLGARVAILFGDEWPEVKVKTLATGDQISIPHEEVLSHLDRLWGAQATSLQ